MGSVNTILSKTNIQKQMGVIKIRQKITSDSLKIKELRQFMGREVEIIVIDPQRPSKQAMSLPGQKSAAGILEQYGNPDFINLEKNIWSLVASEKHANS